MFNLAREPSLAGVAALIGPPEELRGVHKSRIARFSPSGLKSCGQSFAPSSRLGTRLSEYTKAAKESIRIKHLLANRSITSAIQSLAVNEIMNLHEPETMWQLERVWEQRNRTPVLLASGAIILLIAFADWWTKPFVAFGVLYLFPIMLAAGFLPRWVIALLGVGCAVLSEIFSSLDRSTVRLAFETLALAGCGLFVAELVRNRRLTLVGQERLKALVETSPAAIVTVDERGFIELANRAATDLMAPRDGNLAGTPIAAFLPELHHALRWEEAPQFRTSMQCRGQKGNGEA